MKFSLYVDAKISLKSMWEDMFNIAKYQQNKIHLHTTNDKKMDIEKKSFK